MIRNQVKSQRHMAKGQRLKILFSLTSYTLRLLPCALFISVIGYLNLIGFWCLLFGILSSALIPIGDELSAINYQLSPIQYLQQTIEVVVIVKFHLYLSFFAPALNVDLGAKVA